MFLRKCRKLTNLFGQQAKRQFAIFKVDDKTTLKLPWNFSGVETEVNNQYSELYESALEQIFQENMKEGFKFAFKNTIDALIQKDFEYFKETCESNLYYEIEKGLLSLDQMGLDLEGENTNVDVVKVAVTSMALIYGALPQRDENYSAKNYTIRNFSMNGIDITIYGLNKEDHEYLDKLYPMLRVGCVFYSPRNILLKRKEGDIIGGFDTNCYHKFIFESVADSDEPAAAKNMQELLGSISGVLGALKILIGQKNITGFVQKMFGADEVVWKIVDIDDHLQGNPHVQ